MLTEDWGSEIIPEKFSIFRDSIWECRGVLSDGRGRTFGQHAEVMSEGAELLVALALRHKQQLLELRHEAGLTHPLFFRGPPP